MQKLSRKDTRLTVAVNGKWNGYMLIWGEEGSPDGTTYGKETDYGIQNAYNLPVEYMLMQDDNPENMLRIRVGQVIHLGKDDVGVWVMIEPDELNTIAERFPDSRLFDWFVNNLTTKPDSELDLAAMSTYQQDKWVDTGDQHGTRKHIFTHWHIGAICLVDHFEND